MIRQCFVIFPFHISDWIVIEIIFLIFYSSEISQEAPIASSHAV